MTTAQLDHLRKIDAHLANLLDIAKRRTPGRWKTRKGSRHGCDVETDRHAIAQCDFCGDSEDEANAAYIAACAGNAEAGWESTRAVLQLVLLYDTHKHWDLVGMSILAQWPLETLATAKV